MALSSLSGTAESHSQTSGSVSHVLQPVNRTSRSYLFGRSYHRTTKRNPQGGGDHLAIEKRVNALRERWSPDGARVITDALMRINNPFIGRRLFANAHKATQFLALGPTPNADSKVSY